ncbi:alpha/beta hydrolase [Niveispirillum sp. BGYR6]|uniref:alpha/beta fold hydrolase n=1 Tax=Niveispirillum sp. BGYR6 TaxID=2971249 RepID=UPI0022B9BF67|nr:alpha/beta hydrolase [Niveispirillum sp. BGYR6]MDG5497037.1 alpha/beta hydrolase [Niveispirillum sp. BGYR6]
MVRMRRGYADGPYGQIHYLDGREGRPLVLLHQAIQNANQFDYVFEPLLERGIRPIAIDLPGFGLSDAPSSPPSIADYAAVVPPVLDALGLAKAAVGGHHTGALVSNEVALLYPDRVEAAILGGQMLIPDDVRQALIDDIVVREKAFQALPEAAHMVEVARIRERYAAGSVSPARISDYVVQAMQALAQGTYWYGHAAAFAYYQEERLKLLRHPTLILTNTGDMIYQAALATHRLRPDFAFAALEGGGIDIVDQQPAAWAAAIADFLQGL